jgi:hypothetical protein
MSPASVFSMLRLALACLVLGLFAVVPAANAASTTQILRDCADDGVLQGDYTPAELRKARQNIPTDTDEYTDCRDVLARAAAAGVSSRGGSGGSGGSGSGGSGAASGQPPADPHSDEGRAIVGAAGAKPPPGPMNIGGRSVVPGRASLSANGVRNQLPPGMPAALILLGAGALSTLLPPVRRRVLARLGR